MTLADFVIARVAERSAAASARRGAPGASRSSGTHRLGRLDRFLMKWPSTNGDNTLSRDTAFNVARWSLVIGCDRWFDNLVLRAEEQDVDGGSLGLHT